jgi:hypothetical protein
MQTLTSASVAPARAAQFAGATRSLRASPVACAASRRSLTVAASGRPLWCAAAPLAGGCWGARGARAPLPPAALRRANASAKARCTQHCSLADLALRRRARPRAG